MIEVACGNGLLSPHCGLCIYTLFAGKGWQKLLQAHAQTCLLDMTHRELVRWVILYANTSRTCRTAGHLRIVHPLEKNSRP